MADLYRILYEPMVGWRVYRHCFDEKKCDVRTGAAVHTTALFVTEIEANDYASYRNRLIDERGDDSLPVS